MSDRTSLLSTGELADEDDPDLTSDFDESEDGLPTTKLSSLHAKNERQFPLMKLPKEVRLNVNDYLFTDLTLDRQRQVADLTTYHHTHEWPDNDFSAYRNLLLTCKEVHDEAKSLWENMYIHHCCFYFWSAPDLYRVAKLLTALGEPYQRVSYALRTRTSFETGSHETRFIDDVSVDLMSKQPGFPNDDTEYLKFYWGWPSIRWEYGSGIHSLGRVSYEIYVKDAEYCVRINLPGLENCAISVHDCMIGFFVYARYLLMKGNVGDIVWDHYDPAAGHAKMKIWEEWDRREYPSCCLERSDIVLTWRAQAMSGQDKAWLALGGDPEGLRTNQSVQDEYELGRWLTAERVDNE